MSIDRRIYSFQYRLISCYVLLLISLAVYAQSGKERFVGRVVDTEKQLNDVIKSYVEETKKPVMDRNIENVHSIVLKIKEITL